MVSVNLSDYCAGDDIHDDTAGFVAAHAAMSPNGLLYFPPEKTFRLSDEVVFSKPGAYLGLSETARIRLMHPSKNGLRFTGRNMVVEGLNFCAGVPRTGGAAIVTDANLSTFDSLHFTDQWRSIHLLPTFGASVKFRNIDVYFTVHGADAAILIDPAVGYDINLADILVTGTTITAGAGIRVTACGDLTITRAKLLACGIGLDVYSVAGKLVASLEADGMQCDNGGRGASFIAAAGGAIVRGRLANSWLSSSHTDFGCVFYTAGNGYVDGMDIDGCHVLDNASDGLNINSAAAVNVRVHGGAFCGNKGGGLVAHAPFSLQGAKLGAGFGFPGNYVAALIFPGVSGYIVEGNDGRGNTVPGFVGAAHNPPASICTNNLV